MIDINKKYRTREGQAVRLLCTDRKAKCYPVVGLISSDEGEESMESWTIDGHYYAISDLENNKDIEDSRDLVEV